jgi:transglutaminase-like putative cysteine protease
MRRSSHPPTRIVRVLAAIVWVALIVIAPRANAAPADKVVVRPRAAWVDLAPDSRLAAGDPPKAAIGDVYDELSDEQVHVSSLGERGAAAHLFTTARYERKRRHIVTGSGVERASELRFSFDPSYERLVFHSIRVIRDGVARDVLDLDSIRVFSEESSVDERIYDGTMTALAIVPDVRPGDVIDSEVTTEGENPVFDGHFADSFALGSSVWTRWLRVRVVLPASRAVATKIVDGDLQVRERELGTEREYLLERNDVAAAKDEHDTPSWFSRVARLRVSDYHSWAEVVEWAEPLYDQSAGRGASVEAKAAELRAANPTADARVLAAIRFVQDDVRYLGIELGEHSHRPHTSASVLAQRFGDCKDKSLLLVALLRALDVEASVALVNTRLGDRISQAPPSHDLFNHAVVHLRAGGRQLWVDATASLEGGNLDRYATLPYGRALVLAKGTHDLTTLPAPKLAGPTTVARETYRAAPDASDAGADAATLDVVTTFTGEDADDIRARLARSSREEIAAHYLNYYAGFEPEIRSRSDLVVSDDRARNVVVVQESYVIPDFLREGSVRLHAGTIASPLASPTTVLRTTPLSLVHPYWARHEIEVRLASAPVALPTGTSRTTDAFRFERKVHGDGAIITAEFELETRVDSVPASDLAAYLKTLEDVRDLLHASVRVTSSEGALNWTAAAWCAGGVFGLVSVVFGYAYVPGWWRRRRWKSSQSFGRGDTAKLARPVKSRADAERDLLARKCACGVRVTGPVAASAWSTIALGDQTITVGRSDCACGVATRRYYVVSDAG